MGQALKILTLLTPCFLASYYLISRLTSYRDNLRQYVVGSLIVLWATALSQSVVVGCLVTVVVAIYFGAKASPHEKVALFFGLAFAMPFTDAISLNPGVNLGALSYPKILILVLLLPLIFNQTKERVAPKANAIDKAVVLYVVWMFLVNFRLDSITFILRENTWLILQTLVPYLAIRYFTKDYGLIFAGLVFALTAQSFVGVLEALLSWYIFTDLQILAGFPDATWGMYKFRWGFLRAQASFMNPLIYGLFATLAFLAAVILLRRIGTGTDGHSQPNRLVAWGMLLITALGMLAPMSRAALISSGLIVVVAITLNWALERRRDPKKLLIVMASTGIFGVFWLGADLIRENFAYRTLLFEVSSEVILDSPWIGYTNPTMLEPMQVLKQGEGIVDLVNTYVIIALQYGLPALALFVFAIAVSLSRLYDCLRESTHDELAYGTFIFAGTSLFAFNLMTTSAFDWSGAWVWITLALCSNFVASFETESARTAVSITGKQRT